MSSPTRAGASDPTPRIRSMKGQKQCIICDQIEYDLPGHAEDLCTACESWLEATKPTTAAELWTEDHLNSLDDQGIRDVGLGKYYGSEPMASNTMDNPSERMREFQVQMHAIQSQQLLQIQPKRQDSASTGTLSVQPSRLMIPDSHLEQAQSARRGDRTEVKAQALEVQLPMAHGDKQPRQQRKPSRMICTTCRKDMPVTKDNDGVHCTRCFNKLAKQQNLTPSSTPFASGADVL